MANGLTFWLLGWLILALPVTADPWRIATYHAPFYRKGPGLLLRDLLNRPRDVAIPLDVIATVGPDVLLLTKIDWDADGAAVLALSHRLADRGLDMPYVFAAQPNTGLPTGRDIDGDGRKDGARDAQGYGRFTGQGGMAVLSRWPIRVDDVENLSQMLWRNLPGSRIGADDPAFETQRLSSSGHWVVPIAAPTPFALLAYHATPPVFDGPKDRNGRRNADETALWRSLLNDALPVASPNVPVVVVGNANADPNGGAGIRSEIRALLTHPRLQDPQPQGPFGLATVDWPTPGPGRLRVSYVLPDVAFQVVNSGVHWSDGEPVHKLVWVDIRPAP